MNPATPLHKAHLTGQNHELKQLRSARTHRRRTFATGFFALGALALVAGQLVRHGLTPGPVASFAAVKPLARSWARPDITDRSGRLLATDIATPSVFADPAILVDVDEVVEFLRPIFPDLDWRELRNRLEDRKRQFTWIKRGITPRLAQRIHNLGLPGISFRQELRRIYPAGAITSHVVGYVDIDNHGQAGIETFVQDVIGVDATDGAVRSHRAPVRLTLDLGVQHVLRSELAAGQKRYRGKAAAGIIMDVNSGAIVAAASLPGFDPDKREEARDPDRLDRLTQGRYELGSVFKAVTLAAAFNLGVATPQSRFDTRAPLTVGGYTISDKGHAGGWLDPEQIFLRSSNVGAALIGLKIGKQRLSAFYNTIGLTEQMVTELGPMAPPKLPAKWQDVHTMTMSYGHGIAVTPLQFAAASAALVNGGHRVYPHFVQIAKIPRSNRVISAKVSREMRRLFRMNVVSRSGTGGYASVSGYQVGGKTGTADQSRNAKYTDGRVISSFIGTFPSGDPKYLTYVLLFEPQPSTASRGKTSAKYTAAPLTARIIKRTAPMLGVVPGYPGGEG